MAQQMPNEGHLPMDDRGFPRCAARHRKCLSPPFRREYFLYPHKNKSLFTSYGPVNAEGHEWKTKVLYEHTVNRRENLP
jgi:hypothetical protein